MKGVFDTKPRSGYDDSLAERYHFPANRNYLDIARAVTGDWIIYREPQRNRGRRAYIGAARVTSVEPDPQKPTHAYARVADFLPFEPVVPFAGNIDGRYWEAELRAIGKPNLVGRSVRGKSLRLISDRDFTAIVEAGFGATFSADNIVQHGPGFSETPAPAISAYLTTNEETTRRIEQVLLNRKIRDANFRRIICRYYEDTCAVTGLRIFDSENRSEVQAAHIWPVQHGGPDVIQNGIALSGTIHWLFDHHLISLTDDYRLLVDHHRIPVGLRYFFERQTAPIRLPKDRELWPDLKYIQRHRSLFKAT